MMCGTADVDGLMASMPAELYCRWMAVDRVHPVGHEAKMLGVLATLLSGFGGQSVPTNEDGTHPFMPWVEVQ